MTTTEAIDQIKHRGHELTEDTLRGLIRRGIVAKPRLDSSLRYDWTPADIDEVCERLNQRETQATRSA